MYLTQESFLGKVGPRDVRQVPKAPRKEDMDYPNRWMEDRNLKGLHKRINYNSIRAGNASTIQVPELASGEPGHHLNVAN